MTNPALISVILPAHDEAAYIGACLSALLTSEGEISAEVIVIANACSDATADVARGFAPDARARGWRLQLVETATPGKLNALNLGDDAAGGQIHVYLDADVTVSPPLLGQVADALAGKAALYASGSPVISPARSVLTRAYARFWQALPFVAEDTPGFGLFAVNAAGRARWGRFPDIISDDTFVRLSFAPHERIRVPATYRWPMVEGFVPLVRVRRRQDDGVREIARNYPVLLRNAGARSPGAGRLAVRALRDPLGFAAYAAVKLAVMAPFARSNSRWVRGR